MVSRKVPSDKVIMDLNHQGTTNVVSIKSKEHLNESLRKRNTWMMPYLSTLWKGKDGWPLVQFLHLNLWLLNECLDLEEKWLWVMKSLSMHSQATPSPKIKRFNFCDKILCVVSNLVLTWNLFHMFDKEMKDHQNVFQYVPSHLRFCWMIFDIYCIWKHHVTL